MTNSRLLSTPLAIACVLAALGLAASTGPAADTAPASSPAKARPQTATEKKALDYLVSKQDADGAWLPQAGPAVTAMVVKALVQSGRPVDDPIVAKALRFIDKARHDEGSYGDAYATYNTAIVLSTLTALPGDAYKDAIAKSDKFLRSLILSEDSKADAAKGITKDHPWYGGISYGAKGPGRPDLSNTQYVMEAIHDAGAKPDDPDIQKMLVFVSHAQAYSETNSLPWAKTRSDGGFIYAIPREDPAATTPSAPAADRNPKNGERAGQQVLTSYGSMTYAGFKSFLYAGLTKDDPRVKAARRWINTNWTLEANPGLGNEMGIYNYYHIFAKALRANGEDTITDAKGIKHDWRTELEQAAQARQRDDGSFVNPRDRWMESDPSLATAYVVLALQEARR